MQDLCGLRWWNNRHFFRKVSDQMQWQLSKKRPIPPKRMTAKIGLGIGRDSVMTSQWPALPAANIAAIPKNHSAPENVFGSLALSATAKPIPIHKIAPTSKKCGPNSQ